ncbi:MAG: hypothetical protein Unbinned3696contig1008_25 [Prokaryotic dsDNA virus sp.]|nr:MAG: hypothetical protein Unbinned3696contig1008_25 [Prokaryotic dsDNA virus sp.]|tara:strand:+ start:472 stop:747 length:276 start_codon:yes stop_codon:yes gene_type:complete
MSTVTDILTAAGGPEIIAKRLPRKVSKSGGKVDRVSTVYKWKKLGIPERHWPLLMKLSEEITLERLFEANRHARGEKMPRKRKAEAAREAA